MTFVGSATETRLRRDDESMRGHRRGGTTKRWARPAPTLRADGDCGRSLCRSSSTILPHRLLLSSQPHLASPIRKRYRISASKYYGLEATAGVCTATGERRARGATSQEYPAGLPHMEDHPHVPTILAAANPTFLSCLSLLSYRPSLRPYAASGPLSDFPDL